MNAEKDAVYPTRFNRRRWKRVPCDLSVICGMEGGERKARAVDISGGGVLLKIEGEDCHSGKLYMSFVIPGSARDKRMNVIGNIARTALFADDGKELGLGVSFVDIQSETHKLILSYVEGMLVDGVR